MNLSTREEQTPDIASINPFHLATVLEGSEECETI